MTETILFRTNSEQPRLTIPRMRAIATRRLGATLENSQGVLGLFHSEEYSLDGTKFSFYQENYHPMESGSRDVTLVTADRDDSIAAKVRQELVKYEQS